ncbi:MAG: hypothetical protein AAGF30_06450 [Pseudomonadota bacterium]
MITNGQFIGALTPRDYAADTRTRIETLSRELASDRLSDLGTALRSDFSRISVAAHDLRTYQARSANLSQATAWGAGLQTALDGMAGDLRRVFDAAPLTLSEGSAPDLSALAEVGAGAFTDIVSRLDTSLGGRGLFIGGLPTPSPLPDAGTMMTDLSALAAAAPDVTALIDAVDGYFATGGPYDLAVTSLPPNPVTFPFGPDQAARFPASAAAPEIRDALRHAALAAVLPEAGFPMDATDRGVLKAQLVEGLADGLSGLARLQGRIGAIEARVASLTESADANRARQETALADAIAPDQFETATRLQAEMSRLETTYAITARRSQLRLTDYIR